MISCRTRWRWIWIVFRCCALCHQALSFCLFQYDCICQIKFFLNCENKRSIKCRVHEIWCNFFSLQRRIATIWIGVVANRSIIVNKALAYPNQLIAVSTAILRIYKITTPMCQLKFGARTGLAIHWK